MLRMFFPELVDGGADIITHGLGQSGGHHPHHPGMKLLDHPGDPQLEVLPAAEDGAVLTHGRGVQGDGFLKMPRQLQADKGGTALRAVQQPQHSVNPQIGQGRPQGGRVFLLVDGGIFHSSFSQGRRKHGVCGRHRLIQKISGMVAGRIRKRRPPRSGPAFSPSSLPAIRRWRYLR